MLTNIERIAMSKVTLKQVINAINAAESAYGKVIAMIPSIKASGIKKDDLRVALQEAWGFADMKPKSKEYNNTKQKVSKWIATIYGVKKVAKAKPIKVSTAMTNKFIDWLREQNIAEDKIKATAVALANNIA
jgi:hypothetical protein